MTFIFAPTAAWARQIADGRHLGPNEWVAVHDLWQVHGIRPPFKIVVESKEGHPHTDRQLEALGYLRSVEKMYR